LINGPPQVMPLAVDGQEHFVEMPCIPRARPAMTQLIRIILAEFATPLADRFVGDLDAVFHQELLHVAVAQGEAVVEPDPVTDDFTGKTVTLVPVGMGGRVRSAPI
jgi:hypothetical protein